MRVRLAWAALQGVLLVVGVLDRALDFLDRRVPTEAPPAASPQESPAPSRRNLPHHDGAFIEDHYADVRPGAPRVQP